MAPNGSGNLGGEPGMQDVHNNIWGGSGTNPSFFFAYGRRIGVAGLIGLLLFGILIGLLLFLPTEMVSAGFQGGCSQPGALAAVQGSVGTVNGDSAVNGDSGVNGDSAVNGDSGVNGDSFVGGMFSLFSSYREALGSEPLECDIQAYSMAGGLCNQQCDPTNPVCDAGLSCVQEPDGGYVCYGGTDSSGQVCGSSTSTGGHCNQQCDPNNSACEAGLSCVQEPDGGYVCFGGTDATGQTCGGSTTTTGGHCNQQCDPNNPVCDAGLSCVAEPDGGYVCWNDNVCNSSTPQPGGNTANSGCECKGVDNVCTKPDGSISVSYNSAQCGGSDQCGCIPGTYTLACPDGTYAENNPQCMPGGSACSCVCDQKDANGKCIKGHDSCNAQTACLP